MSCDRYSYCYNRFRYRYVYTIFRNNVSVIFQLEDFLLFKLNTYSVMRYDRYTVTVIFITLLFIILISTK